MGGAYMPRAVFWRQGEAVDSLRDKIVEIVAGIEPVDALEREHRDSTLEWIRSGAPIFRTRKPDVPPMHLVSYFALVDEQRGKLLLVDHKLAGLWLPSGGHVEPDEDPRATVVRELSEELNLTAEFIYASPIFITVTRTVGDSGRHTDVSLWYVLRGDRSRAIEFDRGEFHRVRWFGFDEIPFERSDPHMRRFVGKLSALTG
jgi:8-oxo-dGTP diphosphatase